jgi:hypothetical protein
MKLTLVGVAVVLLKDAETVYPLKVLVPPK